MGTLLVRGTLAAVAAAALLASGSAAARQPSVCVDCHGTLPEALGRPVPLWKASIHAKNGVSCNDCHGGDPADPANAMDKSRGFIGVPEEADVPRICGRCHIGILQDYLRSAHGKRLGSGGPTCVTCHGSHGIAAASIGLINEASCSRCHSYKRAAAIREAMQQNEDLIQRLDSDLRRYRSEGFDVEKAEQQLFDQRNRFRRLFHDVDVARVRGESAEIRRGLEDIGAAVQRITDTRRSRRLVGGVAAAIAFLAAGLFYALQKVYRDDPPPPQ